MKWIGCVLISILLLPQLFQINILEIVKLNTFDYFVSVPEPSNNFVILNITDADVDAEGGYPLPRQRLAEIQVELLNNGALGVGWGFGFPHKDRMQGDAVFVRALSYGPSVISSFENNSNVFPKPTGTVILGPEASGIKSNGVIQNIPVLRSVALEGVATARTEIDNLVRRIPLLYETPDGWIASFGTQVLKALTGSNTYIIKTSESGIEEITIKGLNPVKTDLQGRKWISWVETAETTLQEMDVENKFVFVGTTAKGIMPQVATPVGLLEPHKIQTALAESLLLENSPYIPNYAKLVEIAIFLLITSSIWLVLAYFGVSLGICTSLLFGLVTGVSGIWLIKNGLLIDVTWTLMASVLVGTIAFYLRFREQYKLRLQIKKQFEHYLDPRQVKKLQNNPELLKLGGEKRSATFLFTDLRGFTALSEKLEPQAVTEIMNRVLSVQTKCVQAHGGMIDKFIGDAMMAIFNAPLDLIDHEDSAISCALDICDEIEFLNVELEKENKPPVAIGIGINTGEAIIGNMGSDSRFDYTAIGDPVNVAARLESATKEQGVGILIGEDTQFNSCHNLSLEARIKVKGKELPLNVYTIA